MLIFRMKELSTQPKPILIALASLLCTAPVWAVDDPELQTKDKIKSASPATKKSVITPPAGRFH